MPASDIEKRAVRDLCIAKRNLTRLERDAKAQRQSWTLQSREAKAALENALPDGVCYKLGEQYLRRDVYNRMSPIEVKAVRTAMLDISFEEVREHPKYSEQNAWPVFLAVLKRRINDQRNHRGEYVHLAKSKPRNAVLADPPRDVLEIAAVHDRAKMELKRISEATKPQRDELQRRMQNLEPAVMQYMSRTRKERQRVTIGDSLSGGGAVQHGFSIIRKQRNSKPKITMNNVVESVQNVADTMTLRRFFQNKRELSKRMAQVLGDMCQPDQQFYLSLRSSGIRE